MEGRPGHRVPKWEIEGGRREIFGGGAGVPLSVPRGILRKAIIPSRQVGEGVAKCLM